MKITKDFKGLINEGYRYKFEGPIETDEDLIIDLDKELFVTRTLDGAKVKNGKVVIHD